MAITKNPLIRYRILDRCFANRGKKYFIEDLLEECRIVLQEINPGTKGISRRQILEDISFMESSEGWGIDLSRTRFGRKVYYRYHDPAFSISNLPINNMAILELEKALGVISSVSGLSLLEDLPNLFGQSSMVRDQTILSKKHIGFDQNPYLNGIEKLSQLYRYIIDQQPIEIEYQDYKSDSAYILKFHPYYLKQYNNRWFCYGFNPANGKHDWNLAVDRIKDIRPMDGQFVVNKCINWEEYFDDIIGVTKYEGMPIENIALRFYGETCRYVASKPLHGSQRIKWIAKDVLEVRLELIINSELERTILSYGSNVKVESPRSLSDKIGLTIKKALEHYQKSE
jgi:predicted DNA-binding transcriptional regulator YafY